MPTKQVTFIGLMTWEDGGGTTPTPPDPNAPPDRRFPRPSPGRFPGRPDHCARPFAGTGGNRARGGRGGRADGGAG